MRLRSVMLVTHRWLGLATAVVLSIVGPAGAVLIWAGESRLRRVAGRFHEALALGSIGHWMVFLSTLMAPAIVLGGGYLWWKRKIMMVRPAGPWRRTVFDLHHAAGALALVLMFVLSATGIVMATTPSTDAGVRRIVAELHTARSFPFPIKLFYTLSTSAFAIQGVTGVLMWWNPGRQKR